MDIVQKVENYIIQLFKDNSSKGYLYHNFEHTSRVVKNIIKIAEEESIPQEDKELLIIAGWFHDAGYFKNCNQHENAGMDMAYQFLKENNFSDEKIQKIRSLICATNLTHKPQNILEQIMRDADSSHLASEHYFEISNYLREELNKTQNKDFSDLGWAKENLKFATENHHYYTNYAKKYFEPVKLKNVELIRNKILNLENEKLLRKKNKELLNKKKLDKFDTPERGIETMFRVTLNNHTRLSEIADSKANIMLSVNAILISIALSTLIPKLDSPSNSHLIIPTFIMIFFSVIAIICSILSTKPKISSGHFTREDINNKKINLLFFGNFYKMPLEEYNWAMREMMKDKDYLYDSMIKDLYYLGLVLNKKYRWLTITYIIFMIGIITSVLSFVLAFKFADW